MRVGRNAPCPCGSGLKYKNCHAKRSTAATSQVDRKASRTGRSARSAGGSGKKRECADCTECCGPALRLNESYLSVPKGRTCEHLSESGCSLWGPSLPHICRTFMCGYLVEPAPITEAERPDRVGAILHRSDQFGVHVDECAPDGILSILANDFWGPNLRRDLRDGRVLRLSFHGDPLCSEALHVRRLDGRLGCALPTCNPDGSPVIVPVHPAHAEQHEITLFPREQNFRLDAEELIRSLGDRDSLIILPARSDTGAPRVPSCFTQRQAEVLRVLQPCVKEGMVAATTCESR